MLLVLLTLGAVTFIDRYHKYGPELLANSAFNDGLTSWLIVESKGAVTLVQPGLVRLDLVDREASLNFYQELPETYKAVLMTGSVRSEGVRMGIETWNRARLLLICLDENGKRLSIPHQLVSLNGTTNWQTYEKIFFVPAKTKKIRVVAQLSRCSGAFLLKKLSVLQVKETRWYPWLKWTIFIAWGGLLCWLFFPYLLKFRKSKIIIFLLFLCVVVILVGTTVPGNLKKQGVVVFERKIAQPIKVISKTVSSKIRWRIFVYPWPASGKVAHFTLFAAFCFLAVLSRRRISLISVDLLMLAVATEAMQFYVDGRTPGVRDVLIDCGGGFLGLILCLSFNPKIWGTK